MLARIHDLLEIDAQRFLHANSSAPAWVAESLAATPFVVVRRGPTVAGEIAVGVRGEARNQRWAGSCPESCVRRIVTPGELLTGVRLALRVPPTPSGTSTASGAPTASAAPALPRTNSIPALRSLALLSHNGTWTSLQHHWGPGGSVGFELATARHTATPQSDLDIVIYAGDRLTVEEAKRLHAATRELPSAVDVRVETPVCGFSCTEYASRAPSPILLRTSAGTVLGTDPWAGSPNSAIPTSRS